MFEDSVFASAAKPGSPRTRLAVVSALLTQAAVLTLVALVPLLHPEALPTAFVVAPLARLVDPHSPKPLPIKPVVIHIASTSAYRTLPAPAPHVLQTEGGRGGGRPIPGNGPDEPNLTSIGPGMGAIATNGPAFGLASSTTAPNVVATPRPAPAGPVNISSGVSAGMLLAAIHPIYPPIAKAAHVEGDVLLEATISPTGHIVGLHVVSGPPMLRAAALEAVEQARYKPYFLNGQPTAVSTRIAVHFTLGG